MPNLKDNEVYILSLLLLMPRDIDTVSKQMGLTYGKAMLLLQSMQERGLVMPDESAYKKNGKRKWDQIVITHNGKLALEEVTSSMSASVTSDGGSNA